MAIKLEGMNAAQLGDLVNKANRRIEQLKGSELQAARKQVMQIAKEGGFDPKDLIGNSPSTTSAPAGNRKPKYRNPQDHSQVWGGRGKHPGWLATALKGGAKIEQFLLH
jgi:DNA-binding protein H-NS